MTRGPFIWIASAIVIVLALPFVGSILPQEDKCTSASSAIHAAKKLVTASIETPATAEFPSGTAAYSAADLGQCQHRISGYFDAQNLSGAMVRSRFEAVVAYSNKSDDWFLKDLSITK